MIAAAGNQPKSRWSPCHAKKRDEVVQQRRARSSLKQQLGNAVTHRF